MSAKKTTGAITRSEPNAASSTHGNNKEPLLRNMVDGLHNASDPEQALQLINHVLTGLPAVSFFTILIDGHASPFLTDHVQSLDEALIARTLQKQQLLMKESDDLPFTNGLPVIINIRRHTVGSRQHPLLYLQRSGLEELLIIRLLHHRKPVGTLVLYGAVAGAFRKNTLPVLRDVTTRLAAALYERTRKGPQSATVTGPVASSFPAAIEPVKEEVPAEQLLKGVISVSEEMQEVARKVLLVAATDSTVLLSGETGTGKEVIATAIHLHSMRCEQPIIRLNCAALPAHLIESELFGHEKGSFTGAMEKRTGKFELADGGTLFLDEIGELPLELQTKLLRVLQEKEIERIGGNRTIKVNVRIIAATNRDLQNEVRAGRFRGDLYYRLNVFPVYLPALRKRTADIPALARHFIRLYAAKIGKQPLQLSAAAQAELIAYPWPGNIRELEHLIERTVLMVKGNMIDKIDLPRSMANTLAKTQEEFVIRPLEEMERDYIIKVVNHCKGRISGPGGAARLLEIPPTTLISKMQKLGIKKKLKGG